MPNETKVELTEKAAVVLEFLQGQEEAMTGAQIAEATDLNPRGIHGVLNSLVKRLFVEKPAKITMKIINKDGLEEERAYTTYQVTALGAEFVAE